MLVTSRERGEHNNSGADTGATKAINQQVLRFRV